MANTETMTIHQALCELKVLDARIVKQINGSTFVFPNKHSNKKIAGVDIDKFCADVKSDFKSAKDLIARRGAIKRAVVMSNATTKITVNGQEYTVAEAIEVKNHGMEFLQRLYHKIAEDAGKARSAAERANGDALEARANEYIKTMFSAPDMKNISEEMKKARADFIEQQTTEVVDPIGSKEVLEALTKEIDGFQVGIDAALSVSNATTSITIEY